MKNSTKRSLFNPKTAAKFAKEDTILDTLIVAKLLLRGHGCHDCPSMLISSLRDKCAHPVDQKFVKKEELARGRGVCALWGKYDFR